MKKLLTLVLALVLALCAFTGCKNDNAEKVGELEIPAFAGLEEPDYSSLQVPADFKIGMICLHDESSTYDLNFIRAAREAVAQLGMNANPLVIKTGIPENATCKTAADELVEAGCSVIFADSFGHEDYIKAAAQEHSDVMFCHATGVQAASSGLDNFFNAFASIYEGRYLAGVAAGMKLKELYADNDGNVSDANAKMGYVGAYTYAEVISGYTSFYLGAKSIVPNVKMDVRFTGSWYSIADEKSAAEALINGGAKIISQHADSMGAPSACEEAGIPNVSYNGSTYESCPESFVISSAINWAPYIKHIIAQTVKGQPITQDYVGTLKTGSVVLSKVNGDVAANGTVEKLVEVRNALANGTLNVFDTSKFTVKNDTVTEKIVNGVNVIENGIFKESKVQSAPYFDYQIDGITLLNTMF